MTQCNNTISKKAVLILDLLLFFYYLCFHLCLSVCLLGLPLITVILLLIGLPYENKGFHSFMLPGCLEKYCTNFHVHLWKGWP